MAPAANYKGPYPYRALLASINKLIRPYRVRFWLPTILRFSTDIVYLYTSYAISILIAFFGSYKPGGSLTRFWFLFWTWVGTYVYVVVVRQIAKYHIYRVSEKINLDCQLTAINHLSRLDIAWHEKENTGNKLKRVQSGGEGYRQLLRMWVDRFIEIMVNFVGMIVIMAFIDLTVAAIMLAFIITYSAIAIPLSRRASTAAREVSQLEEDFSGSLFELLNNIRSVKVMGLFKELYVRLKVQSKTLFTATTRRIYRFRSKSAIQGVWQLCFRAAAILVIVYGIIKGHYSVAFLLLFNFYFTNLRASVEEFSEVSQEVTIARYHISRLETTLRETVKIDNDTDKIDFPENWRTIELKNVSFAYGDNHVLKNVSFSIRRGERIGIVGLSGAGKSTLFKLLLKEYENFTGDILFDGVSIRKIKKPAYFNRVAVVLQDTEVFNFSLKDNITIASPDTSDDAVLTTAITVAHVTDFLPKLPRGLDTVIGEKGIKLSGGEKQRLGIARAIYKQPDLLFLDEATSHLDLESEEKIKDSLHRFFQNVTAVVIAHRLTTIQEMDRILLIENGELLEAGNFQKLMATHGRFFELWQKQRL